MAIITKIEAQKKNDDRVNIYVDEKFFMAIYKELVFSFNLKKGQEIDKDYLKNILDDEIYMKAKNKALNILSKSSQSEKQIQQKLSKDFEEHTIDRVIEFLQKYKFVDDEDLANISSYDEFLNILVNEVFMECARILRPKKYMCLVVSDFRNKSEYISFHSDLIQSLNKRNTQDGYKLSLQGTKILLQNHKSLLPYGYPFAYVENIHHQYVLIFR